MYKIIKNHCSNYPNPIILTIGDIVTLGKEETKEAWLGWVWAECTDKTTNNKGWIPKQIITISRNNRTAVVAEDYSAYELNVKIGDTIEVIKSLNGWAWVSNTITKEQGWIPCEVVGEKK